MEIEKVEFNNNSKLVRVEAFAYANKLDTVAYGEIFIPYKLYEEMEDFICNYKYSIRGLDGDNSEVQTEPLAIEVITFEEATLLENRTGYTTSIKDAMKEILTLEIDARLDDDDPIRNHLYIKELTDEINKLRI